MEPSRESNAKPHVAQESKEEIDRFGLEALGPSTVFARSTSAQSSSLKIIGALVG
ncbi:hypothetical protein KIN20_013367 [Parelaphostrongylus tenuis]|uniref:Uncharacterized protein n=1 Tax=Parelaphostrongylus tenuis TaxID=148309 RepID=A0AAD5MXB1_PARTN|nr:hypothetical protein KIN20_013367 [Parelaphostrongylus tenuis]